MSDTTTAPAAIVEREFPIRRNSSGACSPGHTWSTNGRQRPTCTWTSDEFDSIVTWVLSPTDGGTRLRMKQVGFPPNHPHFYHGARAGWPKSFDGIEPLLARID